MTKMQSTISRKDIWFLRNKEENSVLQMPDRTINFMSEADAIKALSRYKNKNSYEVVKGSIRAENERGGSMVDDFLSDVSPSIKSLEDLIPKKWKK